MSYSRRQLEQMMEPLGESVTRKEGGRMIYGGGGSSGGGGTSTTTQSIPAELKPLATAYTNKAIGLGEQGFTPYTGQRYEDLNATQYSGIGKTVDRALGGSQTFNNAEANLNDMMDGGQNPYLDQMVNRAHGSVLSNAGTQSLQSGSFGNTGIADAAARNMGDLSAQMYGNAYESDQGRRMQAIGMAPQFANQAYTDASQLMNAGQIMQDQGQQNRDFSYQQYEDEQNLPYKQLGAMSGVFGSNLGSSSSTQQSSSGGGK